MVVQQAINIILSITGGIGYPGIFILTALESTLFPLPAEIILIPAGALVESGKMSMYILLLTAVLGSVTGSIISYSVGLRMGRAGIEKLIKKYGKILLIRKDELEKTDKYFREKGETTVFIARFLPVIRHMISLPAGFSKMNIAKFVTYTILGAGIWSFVLISFGSFAGSVTDTMAEKTLEFISTIIIVGIIALVIAYYSLKKSRKS